jgi:hypothetical protein
MEIRHILSRNEYTNETLEECRLALAEPSGKTHLILNATRPGAKVLVAAIEWYWYKPLTMANNLFGLRYLVWEDMDFEIVSFPSSKLGAVKHLAGLLIMQITDRIPMLVSDTSDPDARQLERDLYVKPFPLALMPDGKTMNPLVLAIENDKDSPVYKNRHNDEFLEREHHVIKILCDGVHLTPRQIVDHIYRNQPINLGK